MLAKRSFPPPLTARMVEAGYRDAPDVDSDMAIVFVKVSLGDWVGGAPGAAMLGTASGARPRSRCVWPSKSEHIG